MSTGEAMDDAPNVCTGNRSSGAREMLILAALMYGLAQGSEAFAADQPVDVLKNMQPLVGGKPLPMQFAPVSRLDEFEPAADLGRRKSAGYDALSPTVAESLLPSQPSQVVSAWQRLADYRSQGRVQLLTLWASPRNMVSLQAGRHGGPSLQWSSRVMNRGGATRGLLDRFVASSLGAVGFGSKTAPLRSAAHARPSLLVGASKPP
jgi:hypothetical protein